MKMLVTGAASGIGRAVAVEAARRYGDQAQLLLVDRDEVKLTESAAEVVSEGASVALFGADLMDPMSPQDAVNKAQVEFGGLDAVISNAGITRATPLAELSLEDYEAQMSVNARTTWLLGKAAFPLLSESRGAIVATASISGTHPTPPLGSYSASKAALIMLVRQMALEWGPVGIRCNTVSPGPTVTGLTHNLFGDMSNPAHRENRENRESVIPLRRVGQPIDVANAILFLAGAESSQITGIDLRVDGGLGLTLMPASGGGSGYKRPSL